MKNFFGKYKHRLFSVLFVTTLALSGILLTSQRNPDFELVKNLDIFSSLIKELNLYYVDDVDPGKSIKTGIDEMLNSLDPYTVYIPESKIEDFKFMTTGQYGGIGALIRQRDEYIMISDPYKDFPADKAGLKAGDLIMEIDGENLKNKTTSQVSELLKGEPGTTMKIKYKEAVTEKVKTVSIERQKVQINSVPYYGMLNNDIGYIHLSNFTNQAYAELQKAVKELKENKNAQSLIIDLRGNPGGLLNESIKICNLFIPQNETVVNTKGKVEQWNKTYTATAPPYDTEIPLIVLVNSGSASASEIVSGCLQDLDRAVIVGTRTFGKGLVQTTRELSYNAKLKVTTAKYYIPSGRCIQALDYSHRNEDGSVGRVPDSLITEFQTKNGRKVFDGGGILPDIKIEPEKLSNISTHLIIDNMIFDFASRYVHEHPKIPELSSFSLSNKDMQDFQAFIDDKNFDYETASEESLDKLIEIAKKEKYYDVATQEFDKLKSKIAHDKTKDLQLFNDEIKEMLETEIIGRYYYQEGQIKFTLQKDSTVLKAMDILNNKSMYASILNGTYQTEEKQK